MGTFIIRRLILSVIVVLLVTLFAFLLLYMLPGDPVRIMLGDNATQQAIDTLRHKLYLDQPILVQFGHWISNIVHGDLGTSIVYGENVVTLIAQRLPVTIMLSLAALVVSIIFGLLAGIVSAVFRGSWQDQVISLLANIGLGVPIFWMGILLIYFFGLKLGWLPIQGYTSPFDNFGLSVRQAIMPVFCLAVGFVATLTRQTRSSMLEVIRQDYIRTARANGLRENTIVLKYALKNALIPIITLTGMQLRVLIGGSVLVETVFNIPGIGSLLVRAVFAKDFVIVQGCVLVVAVITVLSNLLVDIAYGWVDPRIRYR